MEGSTTYSPLMWCVIVHVRRLILSIMYVLYTIVLHFIDAVYVCMMQ